MGSSVEKGEWAIVGGTGEFAMACGIIKKKIHENLLDREIIELDILGYCNMPVRRISNLLFLIYLCFSTVCMIYVCIAHAEL